VEFSEGNVRYVRYAHDEENEWWFDRGGSVRRVRGK